MNYFFILFFIFLVLKLAHFIEWSWVWISAPIWAFVLLIFLSVNFDRYYRKKDPIGWYKSKLGLD